MIRICRTILLFGMTTFLFTSNHALGTDEQPTQNTTPSAQGENTKAKLLSSDEYCQKVKTNPTIKRLVGMGKKWLDKPSDKDEYLGYFGKDSIAEIEKSYRESLPESGNDFIVMEKVVNQCVKELINTDYVTFFMRTFTHDDVAKIRSSQDFYAREANFIVPFALFSPSAEAKLNKIGQENLDDFLKTRPDLSPELIPKNTAQSAPLPQQPAKAEKSFYSNTQVTIYSLVGPTFLLLNFLAFSLMPNIRSALIATPFGLGVKREKPDANLPDFIVEAELAVERNKQTAEFAFLFIICAGYVIGVMNIESHGILDSIEIASVLCLAGYLIYKIGIAIAGQVGKCPSCQTTFARKLVNSTKVPTGTHALTERTTNMRSDGSHVYVTKIKETGVIQKEWACVSCGHQWQTESSYSRVIDSSQH